MQGSQATLALFARYLSRTMGLHFPEERYFELDQKMAQVAKEAGRYDLEQYLLWLMSAPLPREQQDALARALTIGETYFLRDPRSYQVLVQELLPELIARRRGSDQSLRIWSAGCSSGEEPYSLAIMLSRVIPDLASWNLSLVATDINPQALERGRRGIYSQWSFRNAPSWLMDYFTRGEDGRYTIIPRIRSMVRFEQLNLAEPEAAPPGGGTDFLDLIFCRNVMLYFEPAQIGRTMTRFHSALRDGGWLFVGPTEVDQRFLKGFSCQRFAGAFVLKKGGGTREIIPGEDEPTRPLPGDSRQDPFQEPVGSGSAPLRAAPDRAAAQPSDAHPFRAPAPEPEPQRSPRQAAGAGSPSVAAAPGPADTAGVAGAEKGSDYPEALALYQAGSYQQAADLLRRALDAGPQGADALALGARACANIGSFSEARQFCEQAIAADRLSAQNHYLLSIILEQQGELEAAAASLKNVLFIDQDYLLAYFALGNLSRQTGDDRESERSFNNALRLLESRDPHEVLPEAEGMTAGALVQAIHGMRKGRSTDGNR